MSVSPEICLVCGGALAWVHDHRPDNRGIDDGPSLLRKKPAPKAPDELKGIRKRAWETRRLKYGAHGHR